MSADVAPGPVSGAGPDVAAAGDRREVEVAEPVASVPC